MKKWISVLGWIIVGLASLFFIQSGIQKLVGTEYMTDMFQQFGYPDWSRILIGLIEVIGAVLLVFPRWTAYASLGLGVLMIGAVVTEIMAGHGFGALLPAQWLIVFTIAAAVRFKAASPYKQSRGASRD